MAMSAGTEEKDNGNLASSGYRGLPAFGERIALRGQLANVRLAGSEKGERR